MKLKVNNPIIWADFPDPDIIRIDDTYYMVSTTMHMMPGCVILRSYDLGNWEIATYVFETLDGTPGQKLMDDRGIYANGMWAPTLRYHNGKFYIVFVANDTQKTYLYTADHIEGPWKKSYIKGFYHDSSLLFDDDGRVYLVYGNKEIRIIELKSDLTGPKEGGIHKLILKDRDDAILGYEGAHIYKINGKYYIFLIHISASGFKRRTQCCYVSDKVDGPYIGGDILDDDMGYRNMGVAQGGIIDTPDGEWYAILFQDHGAVGRIPVLIPMHWENDYPVLGVNGKVPLQLSVKSKRPGYQYAPFVGDDDFRYQPSGDGKIHLKDYWQWNHEPDDACWSVTDNPGFLRIRTSDIRKNVVKAKNTLTQRTIGPKCDAIVTLNGEGINDGDFAGLCVLQSIYGFIGLTKEKGQYYIVMLGRDKPVTRPNQWKEYNDAEAGTEYGRVKINTSTVELKVACSFDEEIDTAVFYYKRQDEWVKLGKTIHLQYTLEQFMGCRFGLTYFSTKEEGGYADFANFRYNLID
ncbi:MAG TPA: acetyl xylan esterase [Lachnospiraceae bacterium]|jgi:beta-xylosidase|nr:acetyl xylan esterase [Lachnospiraceae bacterium]HCA70765.1 acetyl xylan esterase [Lachnospiraceae bacterium]HCM14187.1 acetyl xylan esterase [Lachnospiraceae bacterium]